MKNYIITTLKYGLIFTFGVDETYNFIYKSREKNLRIANLIHYKEDWILKLIDKDDRDEFKSNKMEKNWKNKYDIKFLNKANISKNLKDMNKIWFVFTYLILSNFNLFIFYY